MSNPKQAHLLALIALLARRLPLLLHLGGVRLDLLMWGQCWEQSRHGMHVI